MKVIGVLKESFPGERRVALMPDAIAQLAKAGFEVDVEKGAGVQAGALDRSYAEKGARVAETRDAVIERCDILLQVRGAGANPEHGEEDRGKLRRGQAVIGMMDPLNEPAGIRGLAEQGVSAFALELVPRVTRAQSMDVLSSMATIAGYKAVLLAAEALPRMFPMLMTAAGTVAPARVFVIGAGVAGLQAIATAKRLGAVVKAYDVRPAVEEQVKSVGGKFVSLPLETEEAEGSGGYARRMDEEFYGKQRELLRDVLRESDVVITTAAVPMGRAPMLITAEMVDDMPPGSVIVDLAAERGGNCEVTRAGETVEQGDATVIGPLNLPASVPFHASQMFGRNASAFLRHVFEAGKADLDLEDQITRETLVARDGEIVNERVREALEKGTES